MNIAQTYKRYFLLSMLAHVLLIACIVFVFTQEDTASIENIIPAYAVANNDITHANNVNLAHVGWAKRSVPTNAVTTKTVGWAKERSDVPTKNMRQSTQHASASTDNNHETAEKILRVLHTAIADKQFYPERAIEMRQSGTVRIGFFLFPDGHLERIALLKSSGFNSLDTAALAAVHDISPAREAGKYLNESGFFTIDVIFQ